MAAVVVVGGGGGGVVSIAADELAALMEYKSDFHAMQVDYEGMKAELMDSSGMILTQSETIEELQMESSQLELQCLVLRTLCEICAKFIRSIPPNVSYMATDKLSSSQRTELSKEIQNEADKLLALYESLA